MKQFLGIPTSLFNTSPPLTIHTSNHFDISSILSLLYFSFVHKYTILFTQSSISVSKKKSTLLTFILYGKKINISWEYFFIINHFFSYKFPDLPPFSVKYNIYYPFFFRSIYNFKSKISNDSINLVGHYNSYFGIFDNYVGIISNCKHLLFFSLSLQKFLLYKVFQKNNHIYGKILPHFKIIQKKLLYKKNSFTIPPSMTVLHQNILCIKKNNIQFSVRTSNTKCINQKYLFYNRFLQNFSIQNIYFLSTSYYINFQLLQTIHKFITSKFPFLQNSNNFVLHNPSNFTQHKTFFSLYLFPSNSIAIHINQFIFQYLPFIINSIDEFYSKILKHNKISTSQIQIQYNPVHAIHLLSEFSYLFQNIVPYLYSFSSNLSLDKHNSQYTHINYSFTSDEIIKIHSLQSKSQHFLRNIIIKTLSIFLDKYFIILQENSNIDIIPIYLNMSLLAIQKHFDLSHKASFSKTYLLSYLSNLFLSLHKQYFELPLLFLNFIQSPLSSNFTIQKIYGVNYYSNIPVIINVFHTDKSLHISLSYRYKYQKLKYFFDEMISSILS